MNESQLGKMVLEATERERRRLGQQLHDGLCQTLLALSVLHRIQQKRRGRYAASDADLADELKQQIDTAVNQATKLSQRLLPPPLDFQMLVQAIVRIAELQSISCSVEVTGDSLTDCDTLNELQILGLYRIADEAITHAVAQAGDGRVKAVLDVSLHAFVLQVAVEGAGSTRAVAPENEEGDASFYLKRYAEAIGAELKIRPASGQESFQLVCSISCPES